MRALLRFAIPVLLLCSAVLFSCKNFYISPAIRGSGVDTPGQEETFSRTGRNKYPANTGAVAVYSSMDDLRGYNYETLASLTESNETGNPRNRAELLSALQRRAAELGANAIAIVDEREAAGDILRIRVNAVRILGTKENIPGK